MPLYTFVHNLLNVLVQIENKMELQQFIYLFLYIIYILFIFICDHLCGLVVRVPGYRSRGPGSIPGAVRFSEKQWAWNGVHSAS
jgi:hypothetical protein